MIGLFVTALVGIYTIEDLWEKFGDVKMPIVSIFFEIFTQKLA
jgi:dolichyl-phosphate-mannose-protein mannosyltransferase